MGRQWRVMDFLMTIRYNPLQSSSLPPSMLRPKRPCLPPWRARVSKKNASERTLIGTQTYATSAAQANETFNPTAAERAKNEVDMCIVGGGTAGLSAAKQLEPETNAFEPSPPYELLRDWESKADQLRGQSSSFPSPTLRPRKPWRPRVSTPTLKHIPRQHVAAHAPTATRTFATSAARANEPFNPTTVERAEDEVDVCIVGGGPAGISAAIRLKQLEREKGREIRVVVLEKGAEIGMSPLLCFLLLYANAR
jgi:hypothetical protein